MKLIKALMLLLATLIVVSPAAYAWAVSTPYWKDNPLKIEPGQSKDFVLTLQNMVDEEPVTVKVEWVDNAGIAQFTSPSTTVEIPPGRKDITVPIKVTIPETMQIGTAEEINVKFTQVTEGEDGTVTMATAYEKKIPIEVVAAAPEEPAVEETPAKEAEMSTTTYVLLAIIIIIILAIFFFSKKKKK